MRKITGLGLLAVVATGALGGWWAIAQTSVSGAGMLPYTDAQVIAEGAALYEAHCASCHGADLSGEPDWRERDADGMLPAPPHDETGHTWHHADEILVAITTHGTAALVGDGYQSNMMGFGDVLSGDQIIATLAYIKSTWPAEVIEIHNGINAEAAN